MHIYIYMWAVMCLPIFHGFCRNRVIQGLYIPLEHFTHFLDCCSTFLGNLIRYNVGEGIQYLVCSFSMLLVFKESEIHLLGQDSKLSQCFHYFLCLNMNHICAIPMVSDRYCMCFCFKEDVSDHGLYSPPTAPAPKQNGVRPPTSYY